MRRVVLLLVFSMLGLAGSLHAFDRQGMATMGGYVGWSHLGGAPSLSSEPRSRLSFRGLTKYQLNNHLRVTGSAAYAWNSYKGSFDQASHETRDTLLVISPYELGVEYSFGSDFKAFRPYAGLQMGFYRWRFVSNAPFIRQIVRDTLASQDIARTCFGMGFTVGQEFYWKDGASATLQLGYHHINSGGEGKFTTAFASRFVSSINLTEIQAGLNYYFDLPGRKRVRTTTVSARPDSATVPGAARPNVEKESIQIDPNATQQEGNNAVPKPGATPPRPAPVSTPPPASPPPAAVPDTTKATTPDTLKLTPPPAVPDTAKAHEMPDSTKASMPPPATPDSARAMAPPPAVPDSAAAGSAPPASSSPPATTPPAPPAAEPGAMPPPAAPDTSGVKPKL